jgi:ribosomal protein L9
MSLLSRISRTTPSILRSSPLLSTSTSSRLAHTVPVILTADSETAKGYIGDVVKVKAGYMRNFLYPKGLAVYATKENLVSFSKSIAEAKAIAEAEALAAAEKLALEEGTAIGGPPLKLSDARRREVDDLKRYLQSRVVVIKRACNENNIIKKGYSSIGEEVILEKLLEQHKMKLTDGDSLVMEDGYKVENPEIDEERFWKAKVMMGMGGEVDFRVQIVKR